MPSSLPPASLILLAVVLFLAAGCARDVAAARDTRRAETMTSAEPPASAPPPPAPPPPAPPAPAPSPSASTTAARGTAIRYLAVGDSFTIGTGTRPADAFPARLADRWQAAGRAVVLKNVAVNGFTTQDILDVELPAVAPFAPTLITLAVGANDLVRGSTPERYRAQVRRIFAALASALAGGAPPASVVAIPQPDWSLSPAAASFGDVRDIARRIEVFNTVLREEAEAAGARYLDIFPRMREEARHGAFARDGLHPSAAAHEAWAAEIAARFSP